MWGSPELKKLIMSREDAGPLAGRLVVRPDSGVPKDVSDGGGGGSGGSDDGYGHGRDGDILCNDILCNTLRVPMCKFLSWCRLARSHA